MCSPASYIVIHPGEYKWDVRTASLGHQEVLKIFRTGSIKEGVYSP